MTDFPNVSPYQYEIQSIKIETDRLNGFFEVAASTIEVVFYEHLDKAYISGNISILDDANIFETIDFMGNETVDIQIVIPGSNQKIRKRFFVRQVESAVQISDQSQVIMLSIVDATYYANGLINLQKKYEGRPHEIIENVLKDNFFGLQLQRDQECIQAPIRFLTPNMSPLGVMRVMKERATDEIGSPFYLFASLTDNNIRFYSLKYMLDRPAINSLGKTQPYRFNQKMAQDDTIPPALAAFNITHINYQQNENMNQLIQNGDVGAQYEYHDPISNLTASYKHNISEIYHQLYATSSTIAKSPVYDDTTLFRGKKFDEFSSKTISNVTTSRTFEDINNLHEDNSPAFHREKSVAKALKNFVQKSSLEITVPGINFLTSENHITTGNIIEIEVLKNYVPEGSTTDLIDKKKSGNYLIFAARHNFSRGQRYEVNLSMGKLSNLNGSTRGKFR